MFTSLKSHSGPWVSAYSTWHCLFSHYSGLPTLQGPLLASGGPRLAAYNDTPCYTSYHVVVYYPVCPPASSSPRVAAFGDTPIPHYHLITTALPQSGNRCPIHKRCCNIYVQTKSSNINKWVNRLFLSLSSHCRRP